MAAATPAVAPETKPESRPPDPKAEAKAWQTVFSLAKREADDRRALGEPLRRWARAHGARRVALYGEVDGKSALWLKTGDGELPPRLARELPEGLRRLDLPGGVSVLHDGDAAAAVDPDLLLLAAGFHISGLKRQLEHHRFQAKFRGVELEALYDVGLAIAATLELETLSEEVLLRAVSLLDASRGALYLFEEGRYRLIRTIAGDAWEEIAGDAPEIAGLLSEDDGPSPVLPGARHVLSVPVEIDGSPRGLLVVADKESRSGVGPFPASDRRTLALFANQAAIAIENAKLHKLALEKERLEREMELAAEIQKQILPKGMPVIPAYEVVGWNRPARQVGGDYFDVQQLPDGRWWMVVGDVTGKGMPAALMVSTLHSALRLLCDRQEMGPAMVARLNQHVHESTGSNKFITLILARLDPATGRVDYVNAGHNPGILVRKGGGVERLPSQGLPVGLLANGRYEAASIQIDDGDLLCLYSDGITECEAPNEEELGLDRLIELLVEHRAEPLAAVVHTIDETVVRHAAGRPQGDDQTVVLLRRSTLPLPLPLPLPVG